MEKLEEVKNWILPTNKATLARENAGCLGFVSDKF